MAAAYSSCGRTRVVYAASLTSSILILMYLFRKPRILWTVPVILSMCKPQDRLLEMSIPRYITQVTVPRSRHGACRRSHASQSGLEIP